MKKSELVDYITNVRNKLIPEVESEWRKASDRRLPVFYVRDENKTVKWNREFVEKFNADLDKQEVEFKNKIDKLKTDINTELYKYLVEYGQGIITYNDAVRIVKFLSEWDGGFHRGVLTIIAQCEDIVDLFIAHYKEV
jgi:hypothetical protein